MKKIWLYLENGIYLEGLSFGSDGTKVGEIVFNTSITGYQEIISDPSYAGQFVTFTMPEIGNVGTNSDDMESKAVFCKGMIVRNYNENFSNFRGEKSLGEFLKEQGALGISHVDTRYITKKLRDSGACMMIASTEISDKNELKAMLEKSPRIEDINYIEEVSTKKSYIHDSGVWNTETLSYNKPQENRKKIVAIDFGIKRNILNELTEVGLEVEVMPNDFSGDELINRYKSGEIKGVFLSNGPGDPLILKKEHVEIRKLIDADVPMFAICLGHQLLSIASGYPTYKLRFGQHGGNHPVKNQKTGFVEITAQNHNYNVPDNITEIAEITHINLFDGTIEGVKYKNKNIFSVQHHPEASPGPKESRNIFLEFAKSI
ncbi:MAG: glutamine-hydrolyzing carbamoyl-phosphate synthase small subunit [Campylobacterales bacterium]|nr:glutamine-hydrolyzing carbamoyl-phosphate synthase small subunit [Campylobacterales bacterium]